MFLYIDPGTGSMLFSILIGLISTLIFFGQRLILKLKFAISRGKVKNLNNEKIPYLIFCENKRYYNVFKPICDEFEKRKIELVYWTSSKDDPIFNIPYEYVKRTFIGEGNKAFARLNLMNAGICISTTPGLNVYQWKRSRNTNWYVHIFHSVSDGTGYRMFGLDAFDAILSGGPIVKEQLSIVNKKRGLPDKEFVEIGITYMDVLKERYECELGKQIKSNNDLCVLVAPSWGPSALLTKYGEKLIEALLKTEYKIIIRPHPQSLISEKKHIDSLIQKYPDSEQLKWNFDNDNFNSLYESSIMISDFSGVIFDYAFIFDKTVIYTDVKFDPSPYDAAWLDDEKWLIKNLNKLGYLLKESDFSDLRHILDFAVSDSKKKEQIDELRKQCWTNIGKSKESIVNYVVSKFKEFN